MGSRRCGATAGAMVRQAIRSDGAKLFFLRLVVAEGAVLRRGVPPARRLTSRNARSIDGAHRQRSCPHLRRKLEVAVPFHRLDHNWRQRPQPLAADPVRSSRPRSAPRGPPHRKPAAPVAGRSADLTLPTAARASHACGESPAPRGLVQDPASLSPIPLRISPRNRGYQLVARRHADPPHHHPCRSRSDGSKSDEATGQPPATVQATQCARQSGARLDCRFRRRSSLIAPPSAHPSCTPSRPVILATADIFESCGHHLLCFLRN
jgi:hypothetical protein